MPREQLAGAEPLAVAAYEAQEKAPAIDSPAVWIVRNVVAHRNRAASINGRPTFSR
jgi:hypothetical protein